MSAPTPAQQYYRSILPLQGTRPGFFQLGVRGWLGTVGVATGAALAGGLITGMDGYGPVGWLLIGMGVGSLLRDVGSRRTYLAAWPLLDAVIDWEQVNDKAE